MKIKDVTPVIKVPDFEPVTIEIKIESIGELASLWHRANLSDKMVREFSSKEHFKGAELSSCTLLWQELGKIAEEREVI